MKTITVIVGDLGLERNKHGDMTITRQSTMQRITVSESEWACLIALVDASLLPVSPYVEPELPL